MNPAATSRRSRTPKPSCASCATSSVPCGDRCARCLGRPGCSVTRNRVLTGIVVVLAVVVVSAWGWSRLDPDDATTRQSTRASDAVPLAPSTSAASTPPTTARDPGPPYAVGVVHVTLVDPTRGVAARGATPAATARTLPLPTRQPAANGGASPVDITDAAARRGPRPLVLFAHGLALADQAYPRFLHDLAAAGFVVADPEFPLSSGALPGPARSDPVDQAADLAFVADQLLDPATRPAPLRAATFLDHLAVVGHSDGGITAAGFAANSCCADPRVGAAVVLAGALGRFSGGWFTTVAPPLLVMHGTADTTNPVSSSRGVYAASPGVKRLVLIEGGSHIGAFEDDASRPAVVSVVTDFLRASLLGDAAADARLDSDSNVPGVLVPG